MGLNDNGLSHLLIYTKSGPYPKIIFFFENMDLINKNRFQLSHTSMYIVMYIYIYDQDSKKAGLTSTRPFIFI
jgi:hypothetical protein